VSIETSSFMKAVNTKSRSCRNGALRIGYLCSGRRQTPPVDDLLNNNLTLCEDTIRAQRVPQVERIGATAE